MCTIILHTIGVFLHDYLLQIRSEIYLVAITPIFIK